MWNYSKRSNSTRRKRSLRWSCHPSEMDWPPRSPDLTPIDSFLWDYLMERINEPATIPEQKGDIRCAVGEIAPLVGWWRTFGQHHISYTTIKYVFNTSNSKWINLYLKFTENYWRKNCQGHKISYKKKKNES